MPSYEEMKDDLGRFLATEHHALIAAYGAADKEDKDLGPVRDYRVTFRIAERADFDKVHASLRGYLTQNLAAAFLTSFSAAEKDDKEGGRLREFKICIRVPLLAGGGQTEESA
ncbi:MAG: hypothetical protein GX774_17360 [Armatimonadetes bacterium]|jgi:hypothetical protein|nr:hypothetical protein [Armatimonadota bacterium]